MSLTMLNTVLNMMMKSSSVSCVVSRIPKMLIQSLLFIQKKLLTVPDLIKMDLVENVMKDYQTELLDSVPLVQDNLMSHVTALLTQHRPEAGERGEHAGGLDSLG